MARVVVVVIAVVVVAMLGTVLINLAPPLEKLQDKSAPRGQPITVKLALVAPKRDLDTIPITTISQQFISGDLLSLEGDIVAPTANATLPPFVYVEFVKRLPNHTEIVGNTGVVDIPPNERKLRLLINVPKEPYIGHGQVTVLPAQ